MSVPFQGVFFFGDGFPMALPWAEREVPLAGRQIWRKSAPLFSTMRNDEFTGFPSLIIQKTQMRGMRHFSAFTSSCSALTRPVFGAKDEPLFRSLPASLDVQRYRIALFEKPIWDRGLRIAARARPAGRGGTGSPRYSPETQRAQYNHGALGT